tara:strand:+ start:1504 stop:1755 length:252 start_codon:yes stop_codon:yes gene_type:complete
MIVKMYTSNWCSYCVAAKNFFEEHKIKFEEINIETENISREELLKLSGGYTVPQIFINNKCIGGYDQLMNLYQTNKLKDFINE